MKISLRFIDQIQGAPVWDSVKGFIRQQFEDLGTQIQAGWNTNHKSDGTHADVVATSVASTNGYKEHSRTVPQGEWTDIVLQNSDVTSDTGTYALTTTNIFFRYMRIGKTIFLTFTFFNNGVVTGTPEFLRIKLPPILEMARVNSSYDIEDRVFCVAGNSSQGAIDAYVAQRSSSNDTYLVFERSPSGLWAAAPDVAIRGQLAYEAANY